MLLGDEVAETGWLSPFTLAAPSSTRKKPDPVAVLEAGNCRKLIGTAAKLCRAAARRVAAEAA